MNDKPNQFWDQRFQNAGDGYLFGTEPNAFLVSQKDLLKPGMKVLAVADGEARNGVFMASCGAQVLSIDFSPTALEKGRKLAERNGVTIESREVDLYNWAWPDQEYDLVAAIFIQFSSAAERPGVFAGIKQALKPGGLLLLQGYRPEQLDYGTGGPPVAENMYTEELLAESFADMNITHLRSHDSEVDEGPGHSGMSALIDMIATKR